MFKSIIGAVRTGWYMLYILDTSGFKQSVCDQSFYSGPVSKFWAYAFVLSKAPELDTFPGHTAAMPPLLYLVIYSNAIKTSPITG
ncbi:Elongation of very long chain fatty acids protein 6 [Acipenser ruthenus]|uniref:Elongation of very long chain fatty acids protein 6 n=1 Tax=Acipenser ruthenus TaxID=7906 RepID=A0A444UXU9_ACIRT|nr:Elongation of very long chain fatty acids protein 6 [Acipenser ruthenus]